MSSPSRDTAERDTAERHTSAPTRAIRPTKNITDHTDALGRRRDNRRCWTWLVTLLAMLFLSILSGIALGSLSIPLPTTARVLAHHLFGAHLADPALSDVGADPSGVANPAQLLSREQLSSIVWQVRAPRVILAALVGAGLALTGAVLQAITRNVLADPYILGVHSGASCGAAATILFGVGLGYGNDTLGDYGLQASAFIGALVATALVFSIARGPGGGIVTGRLRARRTSSHARASTKTFSPTRLLLSGVAVGYALSSATSFLVFASDSPEASRSVMFWLLGSLGLASWGGPLVLATVVVGAALLALITLAPRIDALTNGDAAALSVGLNPSRLRAVLLILTCLVVGTLVSMAGAIGFVGLVVPHLARWLVGHRHRWLLPIAALLGAMLLIWADVLSRVILAPQEIPVGIITALVGAPFLLLLLRRSHSL